MDKLCCEFQPKSRLTCYFRHRFVNASGILASTCTDLLKSTAAAGIAHSVNRGVHKLVNQLE